MGISDTLCEEGLYGIAINLQQWLPTEGEQSIFYLYFLLFSIMIMI